MTTNGNNAEASGESTSDVFRVGVRLPPFWPENPAVWFAQVESHFALSGISDDKTRFHFVISQLEHRFAAEVTDIIVSPPANSKYDTLKTELVKRLCHSREKEVKQLLTHEEMGDRRPSQFLRHLRQLAGPEVPEEFLKTIWTSRLPTHVQTAIASQPRADLSSLADLADTVLDIVSSNPQTAALSQSPGSTLDVLVKQVAELTRRVDALTHTRDNISRSRSASRESRRQRSQTRSMSNYKRFPLCFYHAKFKEKARRCIKPCDFAQGNAQSSR
ncbi:hypothetical protein K1T71_001178 [Dendrolimus kikuchii]|uniref:Uncharacterized protein n=4 Tax=Dendrolimus kikuchii TaxID=765133 RepID=A0ACC1CY73_9NEOP|nr:hypothetical protein K1T71_012972 [Dendrolimus kikuchii]KAJ0174356.1 hypothetical protein K1T71_010502 [Dendrolimus kikuchii]KAJ0176293.1 hypothetical protein K1T71_008467 [Dendrolimus kikuchii]KAJ0183202.1 hypothetical protein K1T71_001178 [Dendrolimus kikuchii]